MVHFVPKWYNKMHMFLIKEGVKNQTGLLRPVYSFRNIKLCKHLCIYMINVYICIPG